MNKILAALLPLLFSITAQAAIIGQPFIPEVDKRFDAIEGNAAVNAASGLHQKQVAVAVFDWTSNTSTIVAPFKLPAKATIVRSYLWVKTKPVGVGASIAVSCQTANNVLSALAVSSFPNSGLPIDGVSTGASTVFKDITTACAPTATITGAPLSAGNVTAYMEYVIHN